MEMVRISKKLGVTGIERQGPGFLVLEPTWRRQEGTYLKGTGSDLKCGQIYYLMTRDLPREIQGVMYNG